MTTTITFRSDDDPADSSFVEPSLDRYRENHRIDPVHPGAFFNRCRYCGVTIHPIKGGWRHSAHEIAQLVSPTGGRAPGEVTEDWGK